MKRILLSFIISNIAFAQSISLDTTFGISGKVLNTNSQLVCSSILQFDGKIITCDLNVNTTHLISVERYNNDGSLDTTFGNNGKFNSNLSVSNSNNRLIALQNDGKILVVGSMPSSTNSSDTKNFGILRLNDNGSFDSSYGVNGYVDFNLNSYDIAECIKILPDGSVLVGGLTTLSPPLYDFALIKLNSNGVLDTSFANNGKFIQNIGLKQDGSNSSDVIQQIEITQSEEIIIGGYSDVNSSSFNNKYVVMKLNSNGTVNTSFGNIGEKVINFNQSLGTTQMLKLVLDTADNIILAGSVMDSGSSISKIALIKLDSNGNFISSFGNNGAVITNIYSNKEYLSDLLIDNYGNLLCSANTKTSQSSVNDSEFILLEFNSDGSLNTNFNSTGFYLVDFSQNFDIPYSILKQNDGKIILVGASDIDGNLINFQCAMARFEISDLNIQVNSILNKNNVYPNPFSNTIHINSSGIETISIYDVLGKSYLLMPHINNDEITIDTENLQRGIYFLKYGNKENSHLDKLIKN